MKTNIKLRVTPEQSEAVQKICFANGIDWKQTHFNKDTTDVRYIFINQFNLTKCAYLSSNYFEAHSYTEVNTDLFIRTNGTCEESIDIVDNLSNNKSKEDMFKQYGFEVPDFDCELLGSISAPNNQKLIVGVIRKSVLNISSYLWNLDGTCFNCSVSPDFYEYNLTPIKKPWYETCKFPVIVKTEDSNIFIIKDELQNYTEVTLKTLTPLSNEEIDQLKQDF